MADTMDILLKEIADAANENVNYEAMRQAILEKAAEERRKKRSFIRYGAMAATAVILAGVGGMFLASGGSMKSAEIAAPESAEMRYTESAVSGGTGSREEPAAAPMPETYATVTECAPTEPTAAEEAETENGALDGSFTGGAPTAPPEYAASSIVEIERYLFSSTDALLDAWRKGTGFLAAFDVLLAPANWAEGYRLMEISVTERGIAYRCNKAAAAVYNDEYTVFIPAERMNGSGEPAETEVLPEEGCSLDEASLKALGETVEIG